MMFFAKLRYGLLFFFLNVDIQSKSATERESPVVYLKLWAKLLNNPSIQPNLKSLLRHPKPFSKVKYEQK
jgi:hypothetical protein